MLTVFVVLESKNIFDETPLHWAARYDQGDVVTILLKKGAKHNNLNSKGLCPIHVAVFRGSLKALKSIIASKVSHKHLQNISALSKLGLNISFKTKKKE